MVNTFRIISIFVFFATFNIACASKPQMILNGSNPNIRVELLFEVDGCKVYRFYDGSSPRYFTKCKDSSSVGWVESCGKNCSFYAENSTKYVNDKAH